MAAQITIDEAGVPRNEAGRILRGCDVCAGVDYHPRHVHTPNPDEPVNPSQQTLAAVIRASAERGATPEQQAWLVADQMDPANVVRHWDCCRDAGCPEGSCAANLAAFDDKRRDDLTAAVVAAHEKG